MEGEDMTVVGDASASGNSSSSGSGDSTVSWGGGNGDYPQFNEPGGLDPSQINTMAAIIKLAESKMEGVNKPAEDNPDPPLKTLPTSTVEEFKQEKMQLCDLMKLAVATAQRIHKLPLVPTSCLNSKSNACDETFLRESIDQLKKNHIQINKLKCAIRKLEEQQKDLNMAVMTCHKSLKKNIKKCTDINCKKEDCSGCKTCIKKAKSAPKKKKKKSMKKRKPVAKKEEKDVKPHVHPMMEYLMNSMMK